MGNLKLNPAATTVQLTVETSFQDLSEEGWSFDDIYREVSQDKGFFDEDGDVDEAAVEYFLDANYIVNVFIEKEDGVLSTSWNFTKCTSNVSSLHEETGDDKKVLKNIILLIEEGKINLNEDYDCSKDVKGNYVPTFI